MLLMVSVRNKLRNTSPSRMAGSGRIRSVAAEVSMANPRPFADLQVGVESV